MESSKTSRGFYGLLIFAALAIAAGRIAVVRSPEGDTAFLSANDRSRWCTVSSLVDDGTYEIDRQISIAHPRHRHQRPWQTIDKVQHVGKDGELHSYSSKPPLFPTMVAGVYAVVKQVSGLSITDHPIYVPRIILALVNLPLLLMFLWPTVTLIDRLCKHPWSKQAAAVATCFGTMLLPFAISLNNHLPAAASMALLMWLYFCITTESRWWIGLIAGMAAAFAAANELPALSMSVFFLFLFARIRWQLVAPFLAGMLMVAAAFFGTNWIAHQSFRPPYAHRGDGAQIYLASKDKENAISNPADSLRLVQEIRVMLMDDHRLGQDDPIEFQPSDEANRWRVITPVGHFSLVDTDDRWRLGHWDDWYEYPESYWQDGNRRGVDRGEPSRLAYLFHMTIGHHGIFSLTPFWLLFPIGMWNLSRSADSRLASFTWAVTLATVVCMVFYLLRPVIDRNYGGVSVCFRWLLWFAPLWLLLAASTLDRLAGRRLARGIVIALLAISIFSVSTALASPWQSPWLFQYWQFLGWLEG